DLQRFTSKRLQNFVQVFRDCGVSPAISAPEAARIWTRMEAAGKRCSLGLDHGMKSLYRQATMASRNGFCFTDWQVFETAEILSLAHPVGLRPRLVYLDLTGAESARPALLGHKAFDPMECPLHA
ncbi:hypothetical protein, partial [Leisingera sp. ANG-M1]|uniref:hypothetical protein n=1 Tax=Leisingera sp. ANG-M1 TaxID=1577895 RepID=UPI0019D3B6C4